MRLGARLRQHRFCAATSIAVTALGCGGRSVRSLGFEEEGGGASGVGGHGIGGNAAIGGAVTGVGGAGETAGSSGRGGATGVGATGSGGNVAGGTAGTPNGGVGGTGGEGGEGGRVQRLLASDGRTADLFGFSVSVSRTTAFIGALWGYDGTGRAGSAYVFERSGGEWVERQRLRPADLAVGDDFGVVSVNGDMALVSARFSDSQGQDSGSVYVFERTPEGFREKETLLPSDGSWGLFFGYSLALLDDAALIGAPGPTNVPGAAYAFSRVGASFVERQKLSPSDGEIGKAFGYSIAASGNVAVVGARDSREFGVSSGAAYVFERTDGSWNERQELLPLVGDSWDHFGDGVAIDAGTLAVTAPGDDDTGVDAGSVYVFSRVGDQWELEQKLFRAESHQQRFGASVAIRGDRMFVGAMRDPRDATSVPSVHLFQRSDEGWSAVGELKSEDRDPYDMFGASIAVERDTLLVSAYNDGEHGSGAGAAYVFEGFF